MRSVAKKILGVLLPWWWPPYSFLSFRVFKIIASCRVHILLRHDFLILYWGFLSYLSHVTVSLSCIDLLVVLWVINFWLRQRRRFLLILKLIVHFSFFFSYVCVCMCLYTHVCTALYLSFLLYLTIFCIRPFLNDYYYDFSLWSYSGKISGKKICCFKIILQSATINYFGSVWEHKILQN